jgi:hypothetical protein
MARRKGAGDQWPRQRRSHHDLVVPRGDNQIMEAPPTIPSPSPGRILKGFTHTQQVVAALRGLPMSLLQAPLPMIPYPPLAIRRRQEAPARPDRAPRARADKPRQNMVYVSGE